MNRWEDSEVRRVIDALADYYVAKNMGDWHLILADLGLLHLIVPGTLIEGGWNRTHRGWSAVLGQHPQPDAMCLADCLELPKTIGEVYNIIRGGQPIDSAFTEGF